MLSTSKQPPMLGLFRRLFASTSMSSSDCFQILGVSPGSSDDQIKQAFRKLAKTHHPDLGGDADRFVRIQQAYEHLMDNPSRHPSGSSSSSSSTNGSSGSGYWRSWDTSNSWWNGSSGTYSSDKDFESEFEEQWRKYSQNHKRSKTRTFRARNRPDGSHENEEESEHYESDRNTSGRESSRRTGRRGKRSSPPIDIPQKLKLVCLDKSRSPVGGEYRRISKFNGRVCFSRTSGDSRFIFWSNKNKDWKISDVLKDDGNCLAFISKIHPSIECPFVLGDFDKWMVWNDRLKRYISAKIQAEAVEEDYSTWSVEKLREALMNMGLHQNVEMCFEKQELIELMRQYGNNYSEKKSQKISANDPIPEGQFRLCSRQRHDGVVQAPPVLSDTCKTGNNRVEWFVGCLEDVEDWLMKYGDRKRYYGIFDSSKAFCFGLIWKNNKQWARASKHDW